jgi:hypothetical protein
MKVIMTYVHLKRFGGLYLLLVTYVSDYMFVPTRLSGREDADGEGGAALNRSISLSNERADGGTCENRVLNSLS